MEEVHAAAGAPAQPAWWNQVVIEAVRLIGGMAFLLAGMLLIGYVAFSDLAHAPAVHWLATPAVLAATALMLILAGGVLVAG